ncbi:MAG: L-asparaginase [Methylobacter sp.]|nr:MAG: L-asparaginase [Methylobacter sp.]
MKNKKILLVFTGGTIGSTVTAGTINTSSIAPYALLQQFQQQYPNAGDVNFTPIAPLNLLSENLVPADWTALIAAIEAANPGQFDGIIITHGTDTLAFTAAALSCYFHALDIPVLLVSSDYPLADPRANGLANFICAVDFIRQQPQPGVFVPYRNPGQAMHIHQGHHLASSLQLSGDFISVQHKSYMQHDGGFSILHPRKPRQQAHYRLTARFSERVMLLRPYPGLDYRNINLDHADAVLHDLYHSGTACVSPSTGKHHALPEFIAQCRMRNIAVYLAPALHSPDAYQSTRQLIEQGVHVLWDLSIETAYAKLSLAYGNFTQQEEIVGFMAADIAGEHI